MDGNEGEDERTSLLASSSAPRPSGSGEGECDSGWPSLSGSALDNIEESARRLAGDDEGNALPDSDSVDGLLAGYGDDDSVLGGIGGSDDGRDGKATARDVEILADRRTGGDSGSNGVASSPAGVDAGNKRVDDIGDELLGAAGNPALEQRILRQSLRLTLSSEDRMQLLQGDEDEKPRGQTFGKGGDGEAVLSQSQRVHASARALRASVGAGLRQSRSYGGGMAGRGAGGLRKIVSVDGGVRGGGWPGGSLHKEHAEIEPSEAPRPSSLKFQILSLLALTLLVMLLLFAALALGTLAVGPPRQPVGDYRIVEAQVGENFWEYYDFYSGKDSVGSNGYVNYRSRETADELGIAEVVTEVVPRENMIEVFEEGDLRAANYWIAEDSASFDQQKRKKAEMDVNAEEGVKGIEHRHLFPIVSSTDDLPPPSLEPFNPDPSPHDAVEAGSRTETFVLLSSSPTASGPRDSLRLEGRRRFNRGLFVIDLRHMPAGCGTWPAFWLTDEANWPVNGEIDIVEGVNYQDTAKTALHTTRECLMDDVPEGSKTGSWDTAVGIPNRKTGIPDMTFRWAQNCFVYDPHQWINQGCVATDLKTKGQSLGMPLNANGGGVYALEWDPVNRHIRTWVFSPHERVPRNLREALRTATEEEERRVAPDTNAWGLPYGHFPIGE